MFVFALVSSASAQAPAPTLKPCSVLTPTYTIDGKNPSFGRMFAVVASGKQVLVTAHDLFSPNGGLAAQIAPADLKSKVTAVVARDAFATNNVCARSSAALVVTDAAPMGGGVEAGRDVAAFSVAETSLTGLSAVQQVPLAPLAFAAKAPKVGDPVWLASPVEGQQASLYPGKVVEISAGFLFFEYTDRSLNLIGTSGAPILDASGAVVGMNVGFGKMEDGALIGSAAPLGALKQRLEAAAAAK